LTRRASRQSGFVGRGIVDPHPLDQISLPGQVENPPDDRLEIGVPIIIRCESTPPMVSARCAGTDSLLKAKPMIVAPPPNPLKMVRKIKSRRNDLEEI